MYKSRPLPTVTHLATTYPFTLCVLDTVGDAEEVINGSDLFLCVPFVSSLGKVLQASVYTQDGKMHLALVSAARISFLKEFINCCHLKLPLRNSEWSV